MPQPRYITSEAQMGAPGVYILELAPAAPVRGQRRRIIGFAGVCSRGPVGKAVKCSSYKRFTDVFGERDHNSNGGTVYGHVWRALQAKYWGTIYVVRVAAAAAVKASFTLETATGGGGTAVVRIDALGPGTHGNDIQWKVLDATNGDANYWNLAIKLYGVVKLFPNIVTTTLDNTNQVIGSDDATIIRLTKLASGRPVNSTASTDGADADGYTKLGQTVSAFTSVAGTEGSIADTDYTVASGPMEILNNTRGISACAVVGRSNSTIKTKIMALAALASQRVWFECPDDETKTAAEAVTERESNTGGRLSYWFNHEKITDPTTTEEILVEPFLLPMSIISQTDPDIHPGDFDNAVFTGGSRGVYNELSDADRDSLDAGGVSFIHRDLDVSGNDVVIPGNALTCDNAVNNRDLDGRYMKDFLLDALAQRLRGDHFKGNTKKNRAARSAACSGFLTTLAKNDRYIMRDETSGKPQFTYVNDSSVNSLDDQATGLQKEVLIARLIPKNKQIELLATIGVDATISEQ